MRLSAPVIVIVTILTQVPAWCDEPKLNQYPGDCLIAAAPGLIVLPPRATAVEFSYDGLNIDSLLGKPLDPALITSKVIYGDSSSFPYERPDVKGFQFGSIQFTDLLLTCKVFRLSWLGPCSQDSIFKQLKPFGKRSTAGDATSQAFRIYFPGMDRTEYVFSALRGIRGIRWAGYNRKFREQVQFLESPKK